METVFAALGANALVLGALAYLIKALIGARLELCILLGLGSYALFAFGLLSTYRLFLAYV